MTRSLTALVALLVTALALGACGDENDAEPSTGAAEPEAIEPEAEPPPEPEEAEPEEAPAAPVGPLRSDGIGPLAFGDAKKTVRQAFGTPDDTQEVNFGGAPAPRIDWLYDDAPGLRIVFDTARNELAGYQCTESCEFETEDGFGIGDPIADVQAEYGSELEDYAIGAGSLILPSGEDQIDGGLIFAANREGKGKLISLAAFDTIAGPAGD